MYIGGYRPNENYQNLFSNHTKGDFNDKAALRNLEIRINKLEIVAEAMWRLLKQKTDLTDSELLEEVCNVDLEDGRLDGKKSQQKSISECPNCGRKNNHKHSNCLYCGEIILHHPFQ